MFPMNSAQSLATLLLVIIIAVLLTVLIAKLNAALDRLKVARAAKKPALQVADILEALAPAPQATGAAMPVGFDGLPVPAPGEIYDHTVHGL